MTEAEQEREDSLDVAWYIVVGVVTLIVIGALRAGFLILTGQ